MSEPTEPERSRGQVSEVSRMTPDSGPDGIPGTADPVPYAEFANQVAGGEPRNYGEDFVDADLAKREKRRGRPTRLD